MGLVGHYKCNDNAATTAVVDSASGGNNGIAARNTEDFDATGKIDSALNFNGTTDLVDIANPGSGLDGGYLTVCAWIYRNGVSGTSFPRVIDRVYNGQFSCYIRESDNRMGVAIKGVDATLDWGTLSAENSVPVSTWKHCAWVLRSTGLYAYVDGVLAGSYTASVPGVLFASASALRIAERVDGTGRQLKGQIEDLRVYASVLTLGQIKAIHDSGRGTYRQLAAEAIGSPLQSAVLH